MRGRRGHEPDPDDKGCGFADRPIKHGTHDVKVLHWREHDCRSTHIDKDRFGAALLDRVADASHRPQAFAQANDA